MKRKICTIFVLAIQFASIGTLQAQDQVTLQFTGQDQNGGYVKLDRVLVENITKLWQEVLYYPDTTLSMGGVGVEENPGVGEGVQLFQNVPNPFNGMTEFTLLLSENLNVQIEIYNLDGKIVSTYAGSLNQGNHLFRAWLDAPQTYLLKAFTSDGSAQIKMLNTGHAGHNRIEYIGQSSAPNMEKSGKGGTNQPFTLGDMMSYKGYAHLANMNFESAQLEQPQYGSEMIVLPFDLPLPTVHTDSATNITSTEAQLNGNVMEHSDYPVAERGFLFADNAQLIGATEYAAGAGSGSFHYTVSNLQVATYYYYCAYAQSALGIQYGDVLFFSTPSEMPMVQTLPVGNITTNTATCGGNVSASGGANVTARGVCWKTSPNPTIADNHTTDGNGTGLFTSYIPGLLANTTYYVRAYATNSVGTAYGAQVVFTTDTLASIGTFLCGIDSLTDYDGNTYPTVEIGNQCWMKENLRTTHFADGTAIYGTNNCEYHAPGNNSGNVPIYGYYYNAEAVMNGEAYSSANPSGVQGVCPSGWHLPSQEEWLQLRNYVGSQLEYQCNGNIAKALASNRNWIWYNSLSSTCIPGYDQQSNNATGFNAMPAGSPNNESIGHCVRFATSSSISSSFSIVATQEGTTGISEIGARSVRCLLDSQGVDSSMAVVPVVTINTIDDIYSTTASCEGFVMASGGAAVTARGACWSTSPHPTVNDSHTTDGYGTGLFSSSITGLTPGTTYYMRLYATNSLGTGYGEERIITTYPTDSCGGYILTDYDGNTYHTIPIGQQCWMRENLRTTHFSDGTAIAAGGLTSSTTTPYRYSPCGHDYEVPTYGYLYNWVAAMQGAASSSANPSGVQGICPTGWHVPSDAEWQQLSDYVKSQTQYQCGSDSNNIAKALASTKHWNHSYIECAVGNNPKTNNATGFSALPAETLFERAVFWSATQPQPQSGDAHNACLYYKSSDLRTSFNVAFGLQLSSSASVRCLRD